jgi:hypothetical protein
MSLSFTMSSYINRLLDDSWLYANTPDLGNSIDTNADDSKSDSKQPNSEPNSEPDSPNTMPLPPEHFYAIEEEMFTSIQAWAARYKYAFRHGQSKPIGKH